jgi:hypothetical protein
MLSGAFYIVPWGRFQRKSGFVAEGLMPVT